MTRNENRWLVFVLREARDWLFTVVGLVAAFGIAYVTDDWLVAIPVLAGFVVLYVLALFLSARWLGEGPEAGPDTGADETEGKP